MTGAAAAVERALAMGKARHEHVAIADDSARHHARWAGGTLTGTGAARARRLTVVAVGPGGAAAVSAGGDLDDDALRDLVGAADGAAAALTEGPGDGLVPGDAAPQWDDAPPPLDPAPLGEVAATIAATAPLSSGYAEQRLDVTYLGSSTGLRRRHAGPRGVVDVTQRTSDGVASSWWGAATPQLGAGVLDGAAAEAATRLRWAARRVPVPPGRYEVLLAPSVVADLMGHVYAAAGARDAAAGRGPFRPGAGAAVGERIAVDALTLRSDPGAPGLGCAPWLTARASDDRVAVVDNGAPLHPVRWIDSGTVAALVHTRRSARAAGTAATLAVDNLILEGPAGARSLDQMIAATRRGLLLTTVWYVRTVDPATLLLTGRTRDGVYLVEAGEVVGAAPDFRFNESPLALLGRVTEVGATRPALPREWSGSVPMAMAPLRVEGFAVGPPA